MESEEKGSGQSYFNSLLIQVALQLRHGGKSVMQEGSDKRGVGLAFGEHPVKMLCLSAAFCFFSAASDQSS